MKGKDTRCRTTLVRLAALACLGAWGVFLLMTAGMYGCGTDSGYSAAVAPAPLPTGTTGLGTADGVSTYRTWGASPQSVCARVDTWHCLPITPGDDVSDLPPWADGSAVAPVPCQAAPAPTPTGRAPTGLSVR